ncbi:MAG: hypothetical protein Q9183_004506, partial [Haloplaca sp. 2 TL-2023]
QCYDSKNHLVMEKVHARYGDFVRIGPNELAIFDPRALVEINEGAKNPFSKPAWYDNLRPYTGLNTHRSKTVHGHRRRVWDQGFTTQAKALRSYEGHIRDYANQLDQALSLHTEEAIEINKFFYWFSFDVMGHFAFSKSFDMLKDQSWHHAVEMLRRGLALVGPFTPVPWLVRLSFDMPILRVVRDFQSMAAWCAKRMDERIKDGVGEGDVSSKLIAWSAKHNRLISDRNSLNGDAIAMIIAGRRVHISVLSSDSPELIELLQ